MKRTVSLVAVLALSLLTSLAWAGVQAPAVTADAATVSALPQAPLFAAIAEFEGAGLMSQTCAVIRPVATHSQCNYFLCESYGCGAPYHFDPVDCACYCSYMF